MLYCPFQLLHCYQYLAQRCIDLSLAGVKAGGSGYGVLVLEYVTG